MSGVELIAAERKRQVEVEGYTARKDALYFDHQQLADAAACYAKYAGDGPRTRARRLAVGDPASNPKDTLRDLVRAGALIAAAIDRTIEGEVKGDS